MSIDLDALTKHDLSDDCPTCRAQELVHMALLPATAAWEASNGLPHYSVVLHGAAGLLGVLLEDGASREDVDAALAALLDEIEMQIAEDRMMGGPPQGTA